MIDPQEVPRFAGVATFMRMEHEVDLEKTEADAAFLGIPFDDATTYRPGARFGPRALREASTLLKPYNPETGTNLNDFKIVDHDDVPVVPGYIEDTFDSIEERVTYVLDNEVAPAIVGGDHSTTLPVLRAVAKEYGKVSLIQFDAHSDLWTEYFGRDHNHGTTVHHAIEGGLIEPDQSIRIGDRGGLYGPGDVEQFEQSGIEAYTVEEATELGVDALGKRIQSKIDGPAFATIDIDVVDPAYAPGTGTPMPGGFTSREILNLTRTLQKTNLIGFDLVEIAPPYDNRSTTTSILGANLVFEALCAMLS